MVRGAHKLSRRGHGYPRHSLLEPHPIHHPTRRKIPYTTTHIHIHDKIFMAKYPNGQQRENAEQ